MTNILQYNPDKPENLKAFKELKRISALGAFNVQGWYARKKINQYVTAYYFNDASMLKTNHYKVRGDAYNSGFKGQWTVAEQMPLKINTRGIF